MLEGVGIRTNGNKTGVVFGRVAPETLSSVTFSGVSPDFSSVNSDSVNSVNGEEGSIPAVSVVVSDVSNGDIFVPESVFDRLSDETGGSTEGTGADSRGDCVETGAKTGRVGEERIGIGPTPMSDSAFSVPPAVGVLRVKRSVPRWAASSRIRCCDSLRRR